MNLDKTILQRYAQGNCTPEEQGLVESWFDGYKPHEELSPQELLSLLDSLDKKVRQEPKVRRLNWKPMLVAASVLLLGAFAFYFFGQQQSSEEVLNQLAAYQAPTSSNAILVLENQQEYNLDSLKQGDTLQTTQYLITKLPGGELKYVLREGETQVVYNTVRTKQGGTASLVLSDGTKVWLNVNSEITYPVQFAADSREIALKGEGYFEVEQQHRNGARVPFYVRGEQETISVLGTKFNANYAKQGETALLEGKVAIARGNREQALEALDFKVQLAPNQVYAAGKLQVSEDITQYIDWKEGYFYLNEQRLDRIAEKLSSWYGVDIEVDPAIQGSLLFGRISRQKSLKEVLEVISAVIPMEFEFQEEKLALKKII